MAPFRSSQQMPRGATAYLLQRDMSAMLMLMPRFFFFFFAAARGSAIAIYDDSASFHPRRYFADSQAMILTMGRRWGAVRR